MRRIFVDTLYWIAITNRKDHWHQAAENVSRTLVGCHFVTTVEVLTEVINAFCQAGPVLRQEAVDLVCDLHADPAVTIHPQSSQTFFAGLDLYEARPDKEYSLTAMNSTFLLTGLRFAEDTIVCVPSSSGHVP